MLSAVPRKQEALRILRAFTENVRFGSLASRANHSPEELVRKLT
jgi:hypothetical protein